MIRAMQIFIVLGVLANLAIWIAIAKCDGTLILEYAKGFRCEVTK